MATTIIAPKALWNPLMADGVTENPFYADLVLAATRGLTVEVSNGIGVLAGLTDYELLTVAKVAGLIDIGATITGYPVWFKVLLTDIVPEGFPHRLKEDGLPRTWAEWGDENHKPVPIGTDTYVAGNSWNEEELDASVWRPHLGTLTVLNLYDFLALPRPAEATE